MPPKKPPSFLDVAAQLKRDLGSLALQSPPLPSSADPMNSSGGGGLAATTMMFAARTESSLATSGATGGVTGGASSAGPHPVTGFCPKIELVTSIISRMKDIRRDALALLQKAVSALRGTNAERLLGTTTEEYLLNTCDATVALTTRCRVLLKKEAVKLQQLMRLQRDWEDRRRQLAQERAAARASTLASGASPGAASPLSAAAAAVVVEPPENPWRRVAEQYYRWQHEEDRAALLQNGVTSVALGGSSVSGSPQNLHGRQPSQPMSPTTAAAVALAGPAGTVDPDEVRQPYEDRNYYDETELVGQAFALLDDPTLPPPAPNSASGASTDAAEELVAELDGAPRDRSAAATILFGAQLYSDNPTVSRLITPTAGKKKGTDATDASAIAAQVSSSGSISGQASAGGSGGPRSPRRVPRIVVSDTFSRNIQQYLARAVRDVQHPLGRCIKAFVALERNAVMSAFHQQLRYLVPGLTAALMTTGGAVDQQHSVMATPTSTKRTPEMRLHALFTPLDGFGPLGFVDAAQSLAVFHIDRLEFIDAVCELCARRFFFERGIPVFVGVAFDAMVMAQGSGGGGATPGSRAGGGYSGTSTPGAGGGALLGNGSFGGPDDGDAEFLFDDASSVASSRASGAPYRSRANSSGMQTPASSPRRGAGASGGGAAATRYRLDVSFAVTRLLPHLIAAQIELKLLEYFLLSPLARAMDAQFSSKCAAFVAQQANAIYFKRPAASPTAPAAAVNSSTPSGIYGSLRSGSGFAAGGASLPPSQHVSAVTSPAVGPRHSSATPSDSGLLGSPLKLPPPSVTSATPTGSAILSQQVPSFVLLLEAAAGIFRDEVRRLMASATLAEVNGSVAGNAGDGAGHVYANDFYVEVVDAMGNAYNAAEQAAIYQVRWLRHQQEQEQRQQQRATRLDKEALEAVGSTSPHHGPRSPSRNRASSVTPSSSGASAFAAGGGGNSIVQAVGADDVFPMVLLLVAIAGIDSPSLRSLLAWMDTWSAVCCFREGDDASNPLSAFGHTLAPLDAAVLPTSSVLRSKGIEAFVRSTFAAAIEAISQHQF